MAKKLLSLKLKALKLNLNQLGSITTTKHLSIDEIKESKLYGNIYDFSVDYSAISNDKIHDIHAYLMKENDI